MVIRQIILATLAGVYSRRLYSVWDRSAFQKKESYIPVVLFMVILRLDIITELLHQELN